MVLGFCCSGIVVDLSRRVERLEELVLWVKGAPDFEGVDGGMVEEGLWGFVVMIAGRGVERLAVKVVMVIMTFFGTPMGGTRRLGTGELIFVSG